MTEAELLSRITRDPAILSGKPTLRRKRLPVTDVLAMLASGHRMEDVLAANPNLEPDDIRACLVFTLKQIPQPRRAADPRLNEKPELFPLNYATNDHAEQSWPAAGRLAAICLLLIVVGVGLNELGLVSAMGPLFFVLIIAFPVGTILSVFAVCDRRRRTVLALISFFAFVSMWIYLKFFTAAFSD